MYFLLQSTFEYDSSYWTNKNTYNDDSDGRDGGLDDRQYKGSTFWRTSFKEICVVMKYYYLYYRPRGAISFWYPASSLYSLIADGKYRPTHLGRDKWKSIMHISSLQRNCNREGFNVNPNSKERVRLGIIANEQNNCDSPDSFIALGADRRFEDSGNTAGNYAAYSADNGNRNMAVMGYILVR